MQSYVDEMITIPEGPFLLGASYAAIDPVLRAEDSKRNLGLGAVLDSTPPIWVSLPEYRIMPKQVTNGQYQTFWKAVAPDNPEQLLVEDIRLWDYLWQLYPLGDVRVPTPTPGKNEIESYTTCQTAIDALIRSYSFECQRLLLGHHVPLSESGYNELSLAVIRVFAMLRRGLAHVIWTDDTTLERGEEKALAEGEDTPAAYLKDLEMVLKEAESPLAPAVANQVPLIVLLRRLRFHITRNETTVFAVSDCFRPMNWADDSSQKKAAPSLFQTKMPWDELPVCGVSLYEAAAFAAWLRLVTNEPVILPSEAEYEKAFGWDTSVTNLNKDAKHIFPWQGHNVKDFNFWFSRDGSSVKSLEARVGAYQDLMKETSRTVATGGTLYQGIGFGWQWTRERYNELESKYNRFEQATAVRRSEEDETLYDYIECNDLNCRYFSVRGAPDQLGGAGTVTRRYALSPLRGYAECGFRCVASPAGAM